MCLSLLLVRGGAAWGGVYMCLPFSSLTLNPAGHLLAVIVDRLLSTAVTDHVSLTQSERNCHARRKMFHFAQHMRSTDGFANRKIGLSRAREV